MLKVFYTNVSDLPDTVEGLVLSEYRISKIAKIKSAEKRRQSIGAELLLNFALGSVFPEINAPHEIQEGDNGKPGFKALPLYFNLSHSGDIAACAISDSEVGIDVETKHGYNKSVVKRFFSPDEQIFLENSDNKDEAFLRIWTAKESALKYIGLGLNRSPASVFVGNHKVMLIPEMLRLNLLYSKIGDCHFSVCTELHEEISSFEFVELT